MPRQWLSESQSPSHWPHSRLSLQFSNGGLAFTRMRGQVPGLLYGDNDEGDGGAWVGGEYQDWLGTDWLYDDEGGGGVGGEFQDWLGS